MVTAQRYCEAMLLFALFSAPSLLILSIRINVWKWSHSVMSDSLWPHGREPAGFSVHGIFQARVLEWVAIIEHATNSPNLKTELENLISLSTYRLIFMFFFKAKLLSKFLHSVSSISLLFSLKSMPVRLQNLYTVTANCEFSLIFLELATALDYKWPVPLSWNIFFIWLQATHSHGFLPSSSSAALQSPLLLPPPYPHPLALAFLRAQFLTPYHAINSLSDPYGFKYPVINRHLSNLPCF